MGIDGRDGWRGVAGLAPLWSAGRVGAVGPELDAPTSLMWRAFGWVSRHVRAHMSPASATSHVAAASSVVGTRPMAAGPLQSWSCAIRLTPPAPVPGAAGTSAVTLLKERRANRGAARTLMLLPLTLAPPSITAPMPGQPPIPASPSRRSPAHAQRAPLAGSVGRPSTHATDATTARQAFEQLQAGDLSAVLLQLDQRSFAATGQGIAVRRALAQRAIYLDDGALAHAQFETLHAAGLLRGDEPGQWFALLLQLGQPDQAHRVLLEFGLDTPQQHLALAEAWADRGALAPLAAFMARHVPEFTREAQERQWLYLLAYADRLPSNLLRRYRVRFAGNTDVQGALLSPMAAGDAPVSTGPQPTFREARFALVLRARRFDEAARLAGARVATAGGLAQVESFCDRLSEAGAQSQAKALLMWVYARAGRDRAARLLDRLNRLAAVQPSLFTSADLDILDQAPHGLPLHIDHAALIAALATAASPR